MYHILYRKECCTMPESFRIDKKRKKIYLDGKVVPNKTEQVMLDFYSRSGYEITVKSQAKSLQMRKRQAEAPMLSKQAIEEKLRPHKTLWAEYQKTYIHAKHFTLLAWYKSLIETGKLAELDQESKKKSKAKKKTEETPEVEASGVED